MTPQEWAREKAKILIKHFLEDENNSPGKCCYEVIEQALLEARDAALEEAATLVKQNQFIPEVPMDICKAAGNWANDIRSLKSKEEKV